MNNNKLHYLIIFFLVALLPILILRDFTPSNELRYLSIADEAISTRHLFTFTNQGEPYADKPPLYLWIVMLGKILLGSHQMWFLSLFSILPALAIIFIMDRWTRSLQNEQNRITAAFMLMTCGLFLGLAIFIRMDMLMCLFITLSLYFFWKLYTQQGNPRTNQLLFPICVFMALFTKGPVGILVPLLSTIVFLAVRKEWKSLGQYWGWRTWAIIGVGCMVWFSMVWMEGGKEYLNNLLFHQTIDRAVDAFHHKEPFWYYLISMWYSLAPWSLLIISIIIIASLRHVKMHTLETFFATIILTTLIMLSAFSSKIAIYLAPTFPFFVYLAVLLFQRIPMTRWLKTMVAIPAVICLLTPVAILFCKHLPEIAYLHNFWGIAAITILSLTGLMTLVTLIKHKTLNRSINLLAIGIMLTSCVGGIALPKLNTIIGYGNLCHEIQRITQGKSITEIYTWKIHRPASMDVYLGKDITPLTAEEILAGAYEDGSILLVSRQKLANNLELQKYIANMRQHDYGKYIIIEIPRTLTPHFQSTAPIQD